MRRQKLIQRIGVAVVIHVVPAKKHLSRRSTVHKDQSWLLTRTIGTAKELTLNGKTASPFESDQLGDNQGARRVILRTACIHHVDLPCPLVNGHGSGALRACSDVSHLSLCQRSRRPLQPWTTGQRLRSLPIGPHAKEVTAIFIIGSVSCIGAVDQGAMVRAQ